MQRVSDIRSEAGASEKTPLLGNGEQKNQKSTGDDETEDGVTSMQGYRKSLIKSSLYIFFCVISFGVLALIAKWYPLLYLKFRYRRTRLESAEVVLLKGADNKSEAVPVRSLTCTESMDDPSLCRHDAPHVDLISPRSSRSQVATASHRMFEYRFLRFIYDPLKGEFVRPEFDLHHSYKHIHETMSGGLDSSQHVDRLILYGPNQICIPVKSYWSLLVDEVLHPFYIFQVYSIMLWCIEDYIFYAGCIFLMSAFSASTTLIDTRRNMEKLASMAKSECTVNVLRNNTWKEVKSSDLVPGDVMEIVDHLTLPCDVLLLNGSAIVNESMLTGESVPILKNALPYSDLMADTLSVANDKKYLLFSGTNVIQARYYGQSKVMALVYGTGFRTAKGSMMRSILFPKPSKFKFYEDSFKFVGVMTLIACVGFAYSVTTLLGFQVPVGDLLLRGADLTTIIIPPALPAAMTIGTAFAISSLKEHGIFCISPPRVNVSGKIKLMCFDKTGTLTEEGLDVLGVQAVINAEFDDLQHELHKSLDSMQYVLATCHGLTEVHGELVGDPLDIKMFEAVQWVLEEPAEGQKFDSIIPPVVRPKSEPPLDSLAILSGGTFSMPTELGIIRRFDFSSKLQRMSVIVKKLGSQSMLVHVKGSPEAIRELSDPASVPADFHDVLTSYTREGYRVLALASRSLPELSWIQAQRVPRHEIEKNLSFIGLLIMENKLKTDTTQVIQSLNSANIRCVMCTGDHALTAISVARKCDLIDRERRVFLGDVVEGCGGGKCVVWTDVDQAADPVELQHDDEDDDNRGTSGRLRRESTGRRTPSPNPRVPPLNPLLPATIGGPSTSKGDLYSSPFQLPFSSYELAVTGAAFRSMRGSDDAEYNKLLVRGAIFARMSPDDKKQIVEDLADLAYVVGMCGDGANDCGALKAAQVGVSLSEAEASIAAPFTSMSPSITCVINLIREGRAALVTSFQAFKYMALYSMIQFTGVIRLYQINSNLGDWQYLFIDLFLIVPLAVLMSRTKSYERVVGKRPPGSLIGSAILFSLFGQICIQAAFIIAANYLLMTKPWFEPLNPDPDEDNIVCYENTVTFLLGNFQYIIVAFALSKGPPFRRSIYTNWAYSISILGMIGFCAYVTLVPAPWLADSLQLVDLPMDFRRTILILAAANLTASCLWEQLSDWVGLFAKYLRRTFVRTRRRRYRQILTSLEQSAARFSPHLNGHKR